MKRFLWFIIIGISFISCLESDFDTTNLVTDNEVIYLDPSQRKEEFPNDPFRIIGVTPGDDLWEIIVEYTGGCEIHRFFTYWEGNEDQTSPQRSIDFTLLHDNQGDECERLVRDTLQVDIGDVFEPRYTEDTIFINVINGYTGATIEIDPFLSRISQEASCGLSAILENTTCNNGFWENRWFLLSEPYEPYETIWLQPVRAKDTDLPPVGKYEIGIRLMFGFQFSQNTCQDLPEGKIVPVTIKCISDKD